jgi:hypothetical protein
MLIPNRNAKFNNNKAVPQVANQRDASPPHSNEKPDVLPIDDHELRSAVSDPGALLSLFVKFRASAAINRPKDKDLRTFHANVRKALVELEKAPNRNELLNVLRKANAQQTVASDVELVLDALGTYDHAKGPNGRVVDGFFWSRDKRVQQGLKLGNIPGDKTAEKLKELGGVDAAYRKWTAEMRGHSGETLAQTRVTLEKAVYAQLPGLRERELVIIEARVAKRGALILKSAKRIVSEALDATFEDVAPEATAHNSGAIDSPAAMIEGPRIV